jgi:hypothetical protein
MDDKPMNMVCMGSKFNSSNAFRNAFLAIPVHAYHGSKIYKEKRVLRGAPELGKRTDVVLE